MLQSEEPNTPVSKVGTFKTTQKETEEKSTQTKLSMQY